MMLAAPTPRKREAEEEAGERPEAKRARPSGERSLAELLRPKGRGEEQRDSGSEEDNAPLARTVKAKPRKIKAKKEAAAVKGAAKGSKEEAQSVFELSAKRRVTVRKWKDMVLVDVREFYDDCGTVKPGKKGISLSLDQWQALASRLRAISDAVEIVEGDRVGGKDATAKMTHCLIGAEAGDERSIAFTLSPKRRVTVRYFRSAVLIDIREFYDQEGVAKPGKKGISLSKTQWVALQELAPDISAAASKL